MKIDGKMQITGFKPITNSSALVNLNSQITQDPAIRRYITKKKKLRRAQFRRIPTAPWLYHSLECQKRFFIRGELLVDMERLLALGDKPCSLYFSTDFKPASEVQYFKDQNFFQISFEASADKIQDFGFIIQMLNSLGNKDQHQTALLLERYLQVLKILDDQKNKDASNRSADNSPNPKVEESWTFKQSQDKAYIILKETIKDDSLIMYGILRGLDDCREINKLGINESAVKLILGNIESQEIVRILLKQGLVFFSPALQSATQFKLEETLFYVENDSTKEPELTFKTSQEFFFIANILTTNVNVKLEQYRLSTYKNKFNDYLITVKFNRGESQNFMNQLFMQKLICNQSPLQFKLVMSDLEYADDSLHLVDQFYKNKDKFVDHSSLNCSIKSTTQNTSINSNAESVGRQQQ